LSLRSVHPTFSFYRSPTPRDRPSFPTRRSSDLNLGAGWVGFDFHKAFGRPVKVINDAAMQAIGSYRGGRMLFLGLGTGLGATLIDRKSTRLNSSHLVISYAVFCLKKKKKKHIKN